MEKLDKFLLLYCYAYFFLCKQLPSLFLRHYSIILIPISHIRKIPQRRWLFFYQIIFKGNPRNSIHSRQRTLVYSKNNCGFTLVELIITVCVLAIIAVIATPNIMTQLAKMEAKRIRYAITTTLSMAKAESYTRRQNLILCLSDSAGRCNKNHDGSILLFIDNNDDKNFDADTDELFDQQRLDPKYARLQLRAGNRHYIKFWGDSGKPRGFFGHIKYCPTSTYNQTMYQISFNQVGIIKYKPNESHPTGC